MDLNAESWLREMDLKHLWHPYTEMSSYAHKQLIIASGKGSYVTDITGKQYIDAISGLWNVQVGHNHVDIAHAVEQQMQDLAFYPLNGRSHIPGIQLAAKLAELAPGNLERVFFATGGAEAVETAIKMARQFWRQTGYPQRYKVIGLSRGWHGCTLGALAASGVAEEKEWYEPLAQGFVKIPAPNCYRCTYGQTYPGCHTECGLALEQVILQEGANTVAAILAEPVMGLAGMIPPTQEFWQTVQAIARKYDILLIVDEVAMGFGRTGKLFASDFYDIKPDLLTCAKGITSGHLPLSAVFATDRVYEAFLGPSRSFSHGYTFGGHPVSCAAALANLQIIRDENLCERADQLGSELLQHFQDKLEDCPIVGDIRRIGLALAIELVVDRQSREPLTKASELCDRLAQTGVLTRPVGWNNVLPLLPPLNIPREVALEAAEHYCNAIWQLSDELVLKQTPVLKEVVL